MNNKSFQRWLTTAIIISATLAASVSMAATSHAFTLDERVITVPQTLEITSHSFTTNDNRNFTISYCVNQPAYVKVGIHEALGESSYKTVKVLEDYEYKSSGCYSNTWNGHDQYGREVPNDTYYYGINARNAHNSNDKTYVADWIHVKNNQPQNSPSKCSNYWDTSNHNNYCDAIEWATEQGIFVGYSDGSFQPQRLVSRAEAIKVIQEVTGVNVPRNTAVYTGFWDVPNNEWYAAYIASGYNMGVLHGYADGSFKPHSTVNKVEALKMLLETGRKVNAIEIPYRPHGRPYRDTPDEANTQWYKSYVWMAYDYNLNPNQSYFDPGKLMTRAELAEMIYRYHQSSLDDVYYIN